jgi:cytochrome c-type biogenesis protein
MQNVNILTSFIAGIVMFLAPCTLPLVPGFISFISHGERQFVVKRAGMFCLGFLLTFLVFGLFAGILGTALLPYKLLVQRIAAVFVIILGLYMLGFFRLSFFERQPFGDSLRRMFASKASPFFFGVSIALGWSPCVGPVLAGIFFYAAFSWSIFQALWLFLFFAIGFIVPFMLVAHLVKNGKSLNLRSSKWLNIFAGLILIFVGVLLLKDDFNLLASWAYKVFQFIDYEKINNLL